MTFHFYWEPRPGSPGFATMQDQIWPTLRHEKESHLESHKWQNQDENTLQIKINHSFLADDYVIRLKANNEQQDDGAGILPQEAQFPIDQVYFIYTRCPCPSPPTQDWASLSRTTFDNLDSKFQKNFSKSEFHGHALGVTNHLSLDNLGVKCSPIEIKSSDKSHPRLPDSYVIHVTVVHENVVIGEADKDNPTCSPYSIYVVGQPKWFCSPMIVMLWSLGWITGIS